MPGRPFSLPSPAFLPPTVKSERRVGTSISQRALPVPTGPSAAYRQRTQGAFSEFGICPRTFQDLPGPPKHFLSKHVKTTAQKLRSDRSQAHRRPFFLIQSSEIQCKPSVFAPGFAKAHDTSNLWSLALSRPFKPRNPTSRLLPSMDLIATSASCLLSYSMNA